MKTMILLLLLAVSMQMSGQMTKFDTLVIPIFYTDPYGGFTNSEEEAIKRWTTYSIELMSLAILEYAEDCYNDSTKCRIYTCYVTSGMDGGYEEISECDYP